MAEVTLTIGGRQHRVACKDGSEDHLRRMAAMLDERWPAANRAAGGISTERAMLFVALMLADTIDELGQQGGMAVPATATTPPPSDAPTAEDTALLGRIAARLEAIADRLEVDAPTP